MSDQKTSTRKNYPLSMTQMGIYVESMRYLGTTIYNIPCLYSLGENVELNRLKCAVEKAVLAHPYLSARIGRNRTGEAIAIRRDAKHINIPILKDMPSEEELVRPFDLNSEEPLYRIELYDTKDGKYLFLDTHHIISDGTSIRILIEDINAAYQGEAIEQETLTGFDFAVEEQKNRNSDRYDSAKDWYDSKFLGCEGLTMPLREEKTTDGANDCLKIFGNADVSEIKRFCEKHHLTLNAYFTTAFAIALKAYTCSETAVFCTIYDGRSDPRMARSVSMFVKTLPVIMDCKAEMSVTEAIKYVQTFLLNAMSNDIFSFMEISERYGIRSDVLFAYQGEHTSDDMIAGEYTKEKELTLSQAISAFGLDVSIEKDRVLFDAEYDPSMYGAYTAAGFINMLDMICSEMTVKEYLKDIRLVSENEEQAIKGFHDTDYIVAERPAYRLLQDSAEKYPERKALIAADRTLSYKELNSEANALGHFLREKGAGPETVVAVMTERDSLAYVMRQGVLKSGAAFLPLDPDYPEERIKYIMEDSKAKILVSTKKIIENHEQLQHLLISEGIMVIEADQYSSLVGTDNINVSVPNEAPAYVIYTSGSTGRPKGVVLTQKNLVNFVDDNEKNREILGYTEFGQTSLAIAALTFDFAIMEEFVPIANGMTVVLATQEQIMNPIDLAELIQDNQVEIMSCTPSYLSNFITMDCFIPVIKQLKSVDFGAEAFPPELFTKLKRLNPSIHIMNGYGPTEATISCIMDVVESEQNITIGLPNANVHVATLDRDNRLQPLGAKGELVIIGEGVGRGYLGKKELTEKCFITLFGKKAYRSGDFARIRDDGKIEYHGRLDSQVKLRGLRIELNEIESVMRNYPGLRSCIVQVIKEKSEFLAAWFTADTVIDIASLNKYLSSYLASYMVPQAYVQLDEMPLTSNGKIDKRALPVAVPEKKERVIIPPVTDTQRLLCDLFQKSLDLDVVGINENFFELGGTSLSASSLLVLAMSNNIQIVYQDIFNAPTVEKLEKIVLEKQDNDQFGNMLACGKDLSCLANNNNQYLSEIKKGRLGNVLLTGATGFLGSHVLKELIDNTDANVYCLIRPGKGSAEKRLLRTLFYYFDDSFEHLLGSRLFVVEGEINNPDTLETIEKLDYHTMINCAACVKHFADHDVMMESNVKSVELLTEVCLKKKSRFIQISTVSVAGDVIGDIGPDQCLNEGRLDLGQEIGSNIYVYSKYLAEKHVLKCIEEEGLDGKILRMGNLSSRFRDGEFQINFKNNATMNTFRAYAALGCYPIDKICETEEFSFIDEAARAVVLLSSVDSRFTVFHVYNSHSVDMGDIIYAMNELGIPIHTVSGTEFEIALDNGIADESISQYLLPLIGYNMRDDEERTEVPIENGFTVNALYSLGFRWSITDQEALKRMLRSLETLGFFDVNKEKEVSK